MAPSSGVKNPPPPLKKSRMVANKFMVKMTLLQSLMSVVLFSKCVCVLLRSVTFVFRISVILFKACFLFDILLTLYHYVSQ
jgi:hypothetical protein